MKRAVSAKAVSAKPWTGCARRTATITARLGLLGFFVCINADQVPRLDEHRSGREEPIGNKTARLRIHASPLSAIRKLPYLTFIVMRNTVCVKR
jgi:hypothetical protein